MKHPSLRTALTALSVVAVGAVAFSTRRRWSHWGGQWSAPHVGDVHVDGMVPEGAGPVEEPPVGVAPDTDEDPAGDRPADDEAEQDEGPVEEAVGTPVEEAAEEPGGTEDGGQ